VVFGHWAMMGYRRAGLAVCIDSGCVYGGELTALRLDDWRVARVPPADAIGV
jgi:bis(5'-nucleosyl)-tetraphosphatase (symmetrical)